MPAAPTRTFNQASPWIALAFPFAPAASANLAYHTPLFDARLGWTFGNGSGVCNAQPAAQTSLGQRHSSYAYTLQEPAAY